MYEPHLIKDRATLKDNYNKDIIFIILFPLYFYLYSLLCFFLPLLKPPPLLPPFPPPFLLPPPLSFFLPPFPPLCLLLCQSVYRPRKINHSFTRNLKTLNKKEYNLPEGFNLFLNFIKASDNFNKANNNLNPTRLFILQ